MANEDSKKALKEALGELEAARESVRVKMHLLSTDAKHAWGDLEGKARSIQEKLAEQGEKAGEVSALAARDLARSIRKFIDKHAS